MDWLSTTMYAPSVGLRAAIRAIRRTVALQ
ncbi:hypothetical protein SCALM49S_09507 [Streptomyces californicus]